MNMPASIAAPTSALTALLLVAVALAQSNLSPLAIKVIAEVQSTITVGTRHVGKLVPADRVVSGDRVIYTVEAKNTGTALIALPIVTNPIPDHMLYVADSAVGPGAEVSYSVDGGRSFDRAENLMVHANGQARPARAADYTHIRWQLKNDLKGNSVAFVRFRAVVK